MAIINFKCKKCQNLFFCDVGEITFPPLNRSGGRPFFEKAIVCPDCGELTFDKDEVELTEFGQSQLTDLAIRFFE